MATKKHRKGWITGTQPGLQLIHALTPLFLLSFWSFPRLSTSPHDQKLTHMPVLPFAVQVSSTSSASPWERPALGLGSNQAQNWHIGNCQLHPVARDILQPLGVEAIWPLSSMLSSLLPPCQQQGCTNCSQTDLGVKLHLEHRPRGPLLLPSHSWRLPRECSSRWKNQGLLPPFPDITTPCPHGCAGEGKPRNTPRHPSGKSLPVPS